MFRVYCLLIGYAVGCLQMAYFIGRMSNIDIREHGSGNAGTTNTLRVLGAKVGVMVLAFDILKGIAAFLLCSFLFQGTSIFTSGVNWYLPGIYAGLGAVLGHNFPFYLGFRGGKGMATSLSLLLCINPLYTLMLYALGIFTVYKTKYVSLAAIIVMIFYPALVYVLGCGNETVLVSCLLSLLAFYQHRTNITRLVNGNENKFSIKDRMKTK